ncbi:hypothetical protein FACS189462_4420 [Spirochaetia bacterium]|nr:hypothetical protein FACS189462_4420 [Spirochaetia bacterium]
MKRIAVREDKKTLTLNERERGDGRFREGAYGLEHFQEIAAVGEIQNPKTGNFYLEVYSHEYEKETPHVALELPQKPNILLAAKIEIKPEQPGPDEDPHFIWIRDRFTISTILKEEIQKWFVTPDEDGLTGWDKAQMYWDAQAKSVSWGVPLSRGCNLIKGEP